MSGPVSPCRMAEIGYRAIGPPMRYQVLNKRAWMAVVTAALIIAAGQIGHLRVPEPYIQGEEDMYRRVTALAAGDALRADVIVMGDSRTVFGLGVKQLASHLRLPDQGAKPPVVVSLAIFAEDFASESWLWRRMTQHGHPNAKVLIVGVSENELMSGTPGHDVALRYQFGLGDLGWLVGSGRLADAAALLTYRAFPLYARRQSMRNYLHRRKQSAAIPRPASRDTLLRYYKWYRDFRVDTFEVRCLEHLIRSAQQAGVQVVLVAPPIERSLLVMAKGGPPPRGLVRASAAQGFASGQTPWDLYQRAMLNTAMRLQVPYLNYMTFEQSARFAYWDPSHLAWSRSGAPLFTREVAQWVNRVLRSEPPRPNLRRQMSQHRRGPAAGAP